MPIDFEPTDMAIFQLPDEISPEKCAAFSTACEALRVQYDCELDLYRRCQVKFSKSNSDFELKQLIPEPKIVLDCGANTGATVAKFRKLWPDTRIHSFEPGREAYAALCACEPSLKAWNLALGGADGTATLNVARDLNCSSLLGYDPTAPYATMSETVATEEVRLCKLDTWIKEACIEPTDVDLVKMDLQGGELSALHGATELLKHCRYWYLEVLFQQLYINAPLYDEIEEFMVAHGFRCRSIYQSAQPLMWADALYERVKLDVDSWNGDELVKGGCAV